MHSLHPLSEVIVVEGARVVQCELLLLRQVGSKLHVVGRTFVGHEPSHSGLEEPLECHHIMRENRLVGGGEAWRIQLLSGNS